MTIDNPHEYTPMMQQFLEVKRNYPREIVLYRMGDFYETFFDDAVTAAKTLEITLTSRDGGGGKKVDMAGIPYHALDSYLPKLLEKGHKVAICEQMEAPRPGKLVKREVIRVITPGTLLEGTLLSEKQNNYIGAISRSKAGYGLAYCDISTGQFSVIQLSGSQAAEKLAHELNTLDLAEILLPSATPWSEKLLQDTEWAALVPENLVITWESELNFDPNLAREHILQHFKIQSLEGFGCHQLPLAIGAAGAILRYLGKTQMSTLDQITAIRTCHLDDYLLLDKNTCRNLELLQTYREQTLDGSLLSILDRTCTAMGGRLIREWMTHPLLDPQQINARLDAVEELVQADNLRFDIQESLNRVRDIERLAAKVANQNANPRDLKGLAQSLIALPPLLQLLTHFRSNLLQAQQYFNEEVLALAHHLDQSIVDTPPITAKEGGILTPGISAELDSLRQLLQGDKSWLLDLEKEERERTGIKSLKVKYSSTFGYFIEVSHANRELVPADYHRKQTTVNAERYITPSLKEKEAAILNAEENIKEIEYSLFSNLRNEVKAFVPTLQALAMALARLDIFTSLAEVAARNHYCRPLLNQQQQLMIRSSRHPVIEKKLPEGRFIPNHCYLDNETQSLMILTGPNMSGKSSYMRQIGLLVIMAQMGSFVPAAQADIGICDRIFTRVGAVDDIATGQSTFMVEMTETAHILHHASSHSLVLLDEIGRGTSTFDGVSIAWAVSEYIAQAIKARTIFATHYHELNKLSDFHNNVQNFQVAVQETEDGITFLHQVVPGGADKSYGIEVARLAGLPQIVLQRAKEVLLDIERRSKIQSGLLKKSKIDAAQSPESQIQLSLFDT